MFGAICIWIGCVQGNLHLGRMCLGQLAFGWDVYGAVIHLDRMCPWQFDTAQKGICMRDHVFFQCLN